MKFIKFSIYFILSFTILFGADYANEAKEIENKFKEVITLYKDGKNAEARQLTQQAYFGHFENLEAGIRINLGQKKSYAMEKQFGDIRKAIKNEKPIDEIQAMIDKLNAEIIEILPVIESGHKLVAERSDDGGISAAKIEPKNENLNQTNLTQNANPWVNIYNQISNELKNAKEAYEKNDGEAMKEALNRAKFDLYRNKQLEIAVRRYDSAKMDQMIQQVMGAVISKNTQMSQTQVVQALKDIDDLLNTSIAKLPSESYALAPKAIMQEMQEEEIAEQTDFSVVVENIRKKMAEALKLYENGDINSAVSDAGDIYFDEYEASGMEALVGAKNSQLKVDTEASFSKIVALMQNKADKSEIIAVANRLFEQLEQSLDLTKKSSNWDLFLYAFIIILREGFEALIIVTAVIAYLIKTGNSKHLGIVYSSLAVAVILSLVTAYAVNLIFGSQMAAQSREILEGVVMLIAVFLLFYVGFWLLSNAGAKKWSSYIQEQVSQSLSSGDSKTLWWTVFLAVYREGAETVLFYMALIFDAKSSSAL
ncbi:MAG: FTR1 family iron permease, partial [Campylobacter sp.]|nr:FTR1 family iron permease [Campylobacter sp.]